MSYLFATLGLSEIDLEFVVEDQDEGSSHTSEDVGEGTLEESFTTFVLVDLSEAVQSSGVHNVFSTRLHHESSSDGIEGIREESRETSDDLSNEELEENGGVLVVTEQDSLEGIVTSEIAGSVSYDTKDGDTESFVETSGTIGLVDLGETINETSELSVRSGFTNISGKSSSGEIQRIDDHQRSGTSSTSGSQVTDEELPEISLGVEWAEDLFIGILEGEVKGLSWEISDDVGEVSSPEGRDTFFLGNSDQAVNNTLVLLFTRDLGVSILGLEEELDSFDGSDSSLGDSGRDTSQKEVEHKVTSLNFRSLTHLMLML
jgi:hypothetical protein